MHDEEAMQLEADRQEESIARCGSPEHVSVSISTSSSVLRTLQ